MIAEKCKKEDFVKNLLAWHVENKRDFSWRRTANPFNSGSGEGAAGSPLQIYNMVLSGLRLMMNAVNFRLMNNYFLEIPQVLF